MARSKLLLLPKPLPYTSVTRVAVQALANNVYTKLLFDTVINEDELNYDTVNSQFVAPISGLYRASCNMSVGNFAVGVRSLEYLINGVVSYVFNYAPSIVGGIGGYSFDKSMILNAGDILTVSFFQNQGAAINMALLGSMPNLTITQLREI